MEYTCCIQFKGAVLTIWIFMLCTMYYYFVDVGSDEPQLSTAGAKYKRESTIVTNMLYFLSPLAPFIGWITDAWFGRYSLFLFSIVISTLGCVLYSIVLIIADSQASLALVLLYISDIVNGCASSAVTVYSLPFITDQMIGASGEELSAAVDWWNWGNSAAYLVYHLLLNSLKSSMLTIVSVFIYCTSVAAILASLILFKHWLVIHQQKTNSVTQVLQVLNYARKNKYPKNRSALTYWEENVPTRIDLGKEKYGGPFSEENVEDVKTFMRLIPLIFVVSMFELFENDSISSYQYNHMITQQQMNENVAALISDEDLYATGVVVIFIPLLHFILKPSFPNAFIKFTMIKQSILGLFLHLIGSAGFLAIEVIGHITTPNATCLFIESSSSVPINISYYWNLIPIFIRSVGSAFLYIGFRKFVIAQSPHQMKGLLFAIVWAFITIFSFGNFYVYKPFSHLSHIYPSCGFYYYLTQTVIILAILVLFKALSHIYKLRQRNNPVNVNLIIGDIVERCIVQREQQKSQKSSNYYETSVEH